MEDNKEPSACKATLDELKKSALEHYEDLANQAHHWNSFVQKAIEAYNPEAQEQYINWLDERIIETEFWKKNGENPDKSQWNDRLFMLNVVKEKFLSLTQSISNDQTRTTR